jgi:hypothetical protein
MEPISFSITERTYPYFLPTSMGKKLSALSADDIGNAPFGAQFHGDFVLRWPTLADRTKIDAIMINRLLAAGYKNITDASQSIRDMEHAFALVETLGISVPGWFSREALSTDLEMMAVIEVGKAFYDKQDEKKSLFIQGSPGP